MKKTISIFLAALMLTSAGTMALAEENNVMNLEEVGIILTLPEEYTTLEGALFPYPYGQIAYEPDVYYMPVMYFGMPMDEVEEVLYSDPDEITEDEIAAVAKAKGSLGSVLVCNGELEDALEVLEVEEMREDLNISEFGEADGYHFYYVDSSGDKEVPDMDAAYVDEYKMIAESFAGVLENSEIFAPVDPVEKLNGMHVQFETTDLDGNPITSEELFAPNEYTMINYWGTWCSACVSEMEELAALHARMQEKGCGLVGILEDGADPEKMELAKSIMEENGADYPTVVLSDSMEFLDKITSFPTSFFVDKEGNIVCPAISGAQPEAYQETFDTLLAGENVSGLTMPAAAANDAGAYRITVVDVNGDPVEGVAIQFCDDTSCTLAKTGADGVASFDMPEGVSYIVHVLKVPDGYEMTNDEFHTLDVYSDIVIALDTAE